MNREKFKDKELYEKCCLEASKVKFLETFEEKKIYAIALYRAAIWGREQGELARYERLRYKEAHVT